VYFTQSKYSSLYDWIKLAVQMSAEIAPANVQWIYWFCHLPGNNFFVAIDKAFIEDSFNIFGLRPLIPGDFCTTLSLILDQAGIGFA
jgi:hypothetical protein